MKNNQKYRSIFNSQIGKMLLCACLGLFYFFSAKGQTTTTTNALRVTSRVGGDFHNSGLLLEVPTNDYNVIRGYNGDQGVGHIHFFDDTWQGGALTTKSAGAVNIMGNKGVTLGAWNNPTLIINQSNKQTYMMGNVGIGTSTPLHKLDIRGDILAKGHVYFYPNEGINKSGTVYIQARSNMPGNVNTNNINMQIRTQNSGSIVEAMRITHTGNVGIGKTNPSHKLDVNGTINATQILVNGSPITGGSGLWTASGSNVYRSAGNVGIGTTSPKAKLDVAGAARYGAHPASINGLYVTGNFGAASSGVEFRHSNGTQGIGFGYNSIYATGSNTNQDLNLMPKGTGNVGIGTTNPGTWKLAVNGKIRAKEVKVETGWSDFVFEEDYALPTLEEVESHIAAKGHLKDIPSAEEVEANGIFVGEMNAKLLQKIEELTLYLIEQNKEIKAQNTALKAQQGKIETLEHELYSIKRK